MISQYRPNLEDGNIIRDITDNLSRSLQEWYGNGTSLDSLEPDIRSFRNCFMLSYPVTLPNRHKKSVFVKIRRNPKMDTLSRAVQADIHKNIPTEYQSLKFVHSRLTAMEDDFGAIRPLSYLEPYHAIVMEEYPSRTLRKLLDECRTTKSEKAMIDLMDAARKTGRWLYYFHQHIHIPVERHYTTGDILQEVQMYADSIASCTDGRVPARQILDVFTEKLEGIDIDRVTFSQSHADMTCDNVLYSADRRVCVIDIKTRLAPVYADLGLILIHPETSKPQIFSGGRYYPESLLSQYRAEIIAGYFEQKPGNEGMARIYSAIRVLDKWLMYEELMSRYRGIKHVLSIPAGPWVSAYFRRLAQKYLDSIGVIQPGKNGLEINNGSLPAANSRYMTTQE